MATKYNYTKVTLIKGSEYAWAWVWKHKYDTPANLMATSAVFELNTEDLKPWKYRLSMWKSTSENEKAPSWSIVLERAEEVVEEEGGAVAGDTDFNF